MASLIDPECCCLQWKETMQFVFTCASQVSLNSQVIKSVVTIVISCIKDTIVTVVANNRDECAQQQTNE